MSSTETLGDFTVRGHASLRDPQSGRFLAAVHAGAEAAVSDLAQTLAGFVRTGIEEHLKQRSGRMLASVDVDEEVSRATAATVIGVPYAAPLETGSVDHPIPNAFGRGITVMWRGIPGRGGPPGFGIMRDAVAALHGVSNAIVRRHMT